MNTQHQVVEEIITAHHMEDSSSPELINPVDPESFKRNYQIEQTYTIAPLSQYQVVPLTGVRNDSTYDSSVNVSNYTGPAYLLTTAADGTQQLQPLHEQSLSADHQQIQIENVQQVEEVPDSPEEAPIPIQIVQNSVPAIKQNINTTFKKNRPYKCDQCTASYLEPTELDEHKSKHTDDGPFTCVDCHFTFMFKSHYRSHRTRCEKKRSQTPSKPYVIECHSGKHKFPKNFVKKQNLAPQQEMVYLNLETINATGKKAITQHNTIKQNTTRFNPKNPTFKRTKRAGRSDRPYECDECDATFKVDSDLKTHKMKHTGEGPFKCEECEFVFLFRKLYESHQRRCTKKRQGITAAKKTEENKTNQLSPSEPEHSQEPVHQLETVSMAGSSSNFINVQAPDSLYNQPTIIEMRPAQGAEVIQLQHSVFDHQAVATTSANQNRQDVKYELVPAVELDGMSMNQIVNLIKVKAPSQ